MPENGLVQIAKWAALFREMVPSQQPLSGCDFSTWIASTLEAGRGSLIAEQISQWLSSAEFRGNIPRLICDAFPSARRVFFVHIPKAGGTGVRDRLQNHLKAPTWDYSFEEQDALDRQGEGFILEYVARAYQQADRTFFFTGHRPLRKVLETQLVRDGDLVFVVIRDPIATIVSGLNYVVYRARTSWRESERQYWATICSSCGLDLFHEPGSPDAQVGLEGLLRSRGFAEQYGNLLSRYLGDGSVQPIQLIAENVTRPCVVLVELAALDDFLREAFGIGATEYDRNSSVRVISSVDQLSVSAQCFIYEQLVARDLLVYAFIRRQLRSSWAGQLSKVS